MDTTRTLPSGTVTFLFTDIEGSTKLWDEHPVAMRVALARHDAILRRAIESHGGHVFTTIGDEFCAAFATTPDALGAALAAQRALHAEEWDEVEPLRVRVALHTGAAEQREGDYFGPPLNRVARFLLRREEGGCNQRPHRRDSPVFQEATCPAIMRVSESPFQEITSVAEKRDDEWRELDARARWALEHPELAEPREPIRRCAPELRLWHHPTFGVWRSWTIFVPGPREPDACRPLVRRVTWDYPGDRRRLTDPIEGLAYGFFHTRPAISLRDAELPAATLTSLLSAGSLLAIPIAGVEECVGLDGESFGIESYGFLASVRLEWWCDGPKEWRELTGWVARVRSFLEECAGEE
jgi:hypothetical protein